MLSLKNKKVLSVIGDYAVMTLGVMIYTIAWEIFMIPNSIVSGGLTGLCTIIQLATGGAVPVAFSYAVGNAVLLVAAVAILGPSFGVRSLYCIVMSTVFFDIWPGVPGIASIEGNFLFIPEPFMIPIIGGAIEALGIALVFRKGGSTGGSDIISLAVNKYWALSPGKVFLATDVFIIMSVLLLPGMHFYDVVYGYMCMVTFSIVLDYVLMGGRSTVQLLIFSDKFSQIADYIIKVLGRGVTVVHATGWYTKEKKDVLLVLVRKRELSLVEKAVKQIDRTAFMSVSPASGVYGEGFEEIKTGFERKKNKQKIIS